MTTASISLNAKSNISSDLKLDFKFDGTHVASMTLTDSIQNFYHEFDDSPNNHLFEIELSNKRPEQTKVNQNNEIIEDVLAEIFDVKLSNIDLGQVFYGHSIYYYNNPKPVVGQFFHQLGCNGVIKFKFYTPAYVWLIENI